MLKSDSDSLMCQLESDWRRAYESSICARADYQRLAALPDAVAERLDSLRERLDRTEARKAQIMERIERLEVELLSKD